MGFRIEENSSSEDVVIISASGQISAEDYQEVILPVLEKFQTSGKKARLLLHFGDDFKGYTAKGAWEDARVGLRYMHAIDRCALVSDLPWMRNIAHITGSLIPCAVNTYTNDQLSEAKKWLDSGELGLDHSLDRSAGIVNVNISAPLSSVNFEILAHTVDSHIRENGHLNGLVIHAKHFPGWENLGSMIRHISFIKNHHEKIRRVALVIDSSLADLAEKLGGHFLKAEIRHFPYDQLNQANQWAREIS
ncbi:MAG: STAS/SEC14 domain-containing protein [Deltaproteobacteria bacterium]|nr:STAS/SEC14 domain-containing protein [Deltaproteobacteria bacterium]